MADEQLLNTPSVEPQQPDAQSSEPRSAEPEALDKTSETPSWWRRMFSRRGDVEESQDSAADTTQQAEASQTLTVTQTELDRRVQAETDRREAKRAAEAKTRERRELRDKDPWAYAEEERKAELQANSGQEIGKFVASIGLEHDKVSIDPIVAALPQSERDRIFKLDGAGTGLEGRKLVVSEGLKALEKHWKAEGAKDAEAKLRRNSAFRKQILSEMRGGTPEPELLPAGNMSEADKTISDLLRSRYNLG